MSLEEFDEITLYELYLLQERAFQKQKRQLIRQNQIAISASAIVQSNGKPAKAENFGYVELGKSHTEVISEAKRLHMAKIAQQRKQKLIERGRLRHGN